MSKKTQKLLWLIALPMVLGLAACTDNDDNTVTEDATAVETLEEQATTDDQLSVMVTAEMPTAVLRTFDEGSTGAALVRRLPDVTTEYAPETRLVLVPGSLFDGEGDITDDEITDLAQLGLDDGFLAIERPTAQQLLNFAVLYIAKLVELEELQYEELFGPTEAPRRTARRSPRVQRMQQRLDNIRRMAQTRAVTNLNEVAAEMVIFGPNDYFSQQPFEAEATIISSEKLIVKSEEPTVNNEALTVQQERTAAVSGQLADAAATWLNTVAGWQDARRHAPSPFAPASSRASLTRADGETAPTETFTYNGRLYFSDWQNTTQSRSDRLTITVSTWVNHDMEAHIDHYRLREDVHISLGEKEGGSQQVYYPKTEKVWIKASGDGDYNRWYGAFLTQYQTSLKLTGEGSITLESAEPAGSADGSSAISGLQLTKATDGSRVTWTYDGARPQFYVTSVCCHEVPAAAQTGDAVLTQEVSWTVSNPSGSYSVELTSVPTLSALVFAFNGTKTPPYKYVDRSDLQTYTHQLAEPCRAIQTWHMSIENIEYDENLTQRGTAEDLVSALQRDFPGLYVPEFQIGDHDATSLSAISDIINDCKRTFGQQSQHIEELAKSLGMTAFEIVWSRDGSEQIRTTQAFLFAICPKATEATMTHLGWVYGSDGYLYPSADYAKGHGAKPLGIVAYLNDGSEFGNKATEKASGAGHGLVLALWNSQSSVRINTKVEPIFTNPIGAYMDKAKNDFDGLAKTKALAAQSSRAALRVGYYQDTPPSGCTGWFIPATGQWLAMLCYPGLGGADMPTGQWISTPFNINGAAKLSSKFIANHSMTLYEDIWTSSGYSDYVGIYLANSDSEPGFRAFNESSFASVRPVFAF